MPQSHERLTPVKRATLLHRLFIFQNPLFAPPFSFSVFSHGACKSPAVLHLPISSELVCAVLGPSVDLVVRTGGMEERGGHWCWLLLIPQHPRSNLTEVCGTAAVRPQVCVQPNHCCKVTFKRSGTVFSALAFHPSPWICSACLTVFSKLSARLRSHLKF